MAKWLCEQPAKLIDKESSKGKIETGYDADLIVVDDKKTFVVTDENIEHRHMVTPYLNEELTGVVEMTFLAGEKVYDNGEFVQLNRGGIIKNNLTTVK